MSCWPVVILVLNVSNNNTLFDILSLGVVSTVKTVKTVQRMPVGVVITLLAYICVAYDDDYPNYACQGGACHVTSHAFKDVINESEIIYDEPQIEEYHFHVYFFQDNNISVAAARWIQQQLIQKVANHEFLVVLNGINDTLLPDLNTSNVPLFNMQPVQFKI